MGMEMMTSSATNSRIETTSADLPGLQEAAVQKNAQQQSQHRGGGWEVTLAPGSTQLSCILSCIFWAFHNWQQGNVKSPMLQIHQSKTIPPLSSVCVLICIEDTTQFGAKSNLRGLEHDASYVYNDTSPSNGALAVPGRQLCKGSRPC